jgi:hypothetical protein
VKARDAAGNSGTDESDAQFSITTKPYFTSADSVVLAKGGALNYTITYDQGGVPGAPALTVFQKPSWVFNVGNSLLGTAPNADRIDTVRIELDVSGTKDTLVLRVMIGNVGIALPGLSRPVPSAFDVTWRPLSQGLELTVAMEKPGRFELALFDLRGRSIWNCIRTASGPGYYATVFPGLANEACLLVLSRRGAQVIRRLVVME